MKSREIAEHVLQPGNLVWGVRLEKGKWAAILKKGIISPKRAQSYQGALDRICLGLLPREVSPRCAYFNAEHHGPKIESEFEPFGATVVLSRAKLLESVPGGKVRAVGEYFEFNAFRHRYDIKDSPRTVFGIPFDRDIPSYPDEVRVYPDDQFNAIDIAAIAVGIVVSRYYFPLLLYDTRRAGIKLDLPVLDTNGTLIKPNLG